MNNDLQKVIGVGLGIAGVLAAANAFSRQARTVEQRGLGFMSALMLVAAGLTLAIRFENTEQQVRDLLS